LKGTAAIREGKEPRRRTGRESNYPCLTPFLRYWCGGSAHVVGIRGTIRRDIKREKTDEIPKETESGKR